MSVLRPSLAVTLMLLVWCKFIAMIILHFTELGKIILYFHETQKPIAAICHGAVALLSARIGVPAGRDLIGRFLWTLECD